MILQFELNRSYTSSRGEPSLSEPQAHGEMVSYLNQSCTMEILLGNKTAAFASHKNEPTHLETSAKG